MEFYSIGYEEETPATVTPGEPGSPQKRQLHPAFLPSSLPIHHLPKGTKTTYLGQNIHYCLQLKRKPLLRKLLSKTETEWVPRVLKLQESFIYAYERSGDVWVLKGAWDLTRLISLELSQESPDEVTLVFPHRSLQPCEPLRRKTFRVSELPALLESLKAHLSETNIDFDLSPVS